MWEKWFHNFKNVSQLGKIPSFVMKQPEYCLYSYRNLPHETGKKLKLFEGFSITAAPTNSSL